MSAPSARRVGFVASPASSNALVLDWAGVEERARRCPYLHAAITQVRAGTLTREEALIWAALALSGSLWALRDDYVALLSGHVRTLL